MNGLETEWNYSGNQRTATYRNLAPGHYVFEVKATNVPTVWGDKETRMGIDILPPFWRTWWAYLVYFIFISGIVYLIIRYYIREAQLRSNLLLEKITRQKEHQLNQEKIRFFTNITHEFRSPLTLINGPVEDLLKEPGLSKSVGRKLLLIYRNSNRLMDLIDRLLDFRKVETGAMKLKVSRGNIVHTLKEICFPFRDLFAEKFIEFHFNSNEDDIEMWFDTEKLFIIMNNLLSNAYKYTPEKGCVTLEVYREREEQQEAVFIKLTDTGVGIAESHQKEIFDQYYRIEEVKGAHGSGIGLALTKNLVELHQGEISVESKVGEGSSFLIKFLMGKEQFRPDQISEEVIELMQRKIDSFFKDHDNLKPILLYHL